MVAADLATRMMERVPVLASGKEGGTAAESIVVYRHDAEKLALAVGTLLGVAAPVSAS